MSKGLCALVVLLLASFPVYAEGLAIACAKVQSGGVNWLPLRLSLSWNGVSLQTSIYQPERPRDGEVQTVMSYKKMEPTRKNGEAISFRVGRSANGKFVYHKTIDVLPGSTDTQVEFTQATIDSDGYLVNASAMRFGECVVERRP